MPEIRTRASCISSSSKTLSKEIEKDFFLREKNKLKDLKNHYEDHFDILELRRPNKHFFNHKRNVSDIIIEELLEDALIPQEGETKVEITGKYLKIDGDKQPKNLWSKYKSIYEKHTGITLSKSSKIFIEITSEDKENAESKSLFGI